MFFRCDAAACGSRKKHCLRLAFLAILFASFPAVADEPTIDAELDPTFGNAGVVDLAAIRSIEMKIAVLDDARVRLAGTDDTGQSLVVEGLTNTGAHDGSFGSSGVSILPLGLTGTEYATVWKFVPSRDGGFLAVISVAPKQWDYATRWMLVAIASNGIADERFAVHGVLRLNQGTVGADIVHRRDGGWILMQLEGAADAYGNTDYSLQVIGEDGVADSTFGNQGRVEVHSTTGFPIGLAALDGGEIQVLEQTIAAGMPHNLWHRFRADGSDDEAFGPHGDRAIEYPGLTAPRVDFLEPAAPLGGYLTVVENRVRLLDANGQWDSQFDMSGSMFFWYSPFFNILRSSAGYVAVAEIWDGGFGPAATVGSVYRASDGTQVLRAGGGSPVGRMDSADMGVDSQGRLLFAHAPQVRRLRSAALAAAAAAVPSSGTPSLLLIVVGIAFGTRFVRRRADVPTRCGPGDRESATRAEQPRRSPQRRI